MSSSITNSDNFKKVGALSCSLCSLYVNPALPSAFYPRVITFICLMELPIYPFLNHLRILRSSHSIMNRCHPFSINTSVDTKISYKNIQIYRVIQEELPPLMELISADILSKNCHINMGPILNIYRVTFVIGNAPL
jgi:hypothetical protein